MDKKNNYSIFGITLLLGSIWGLSEAALGMWLRQCASSISGSLMTGVAFLFFALIWALFRRRFLILLMALIATFFKMVDALLLGLPLRHGAIGNPIFAFFTEALAFILILSLLDRTLLTKKGGQALGGALAAVVAVNLFPLVKFATGVPACVVSGTGYPLSLYYIHVAVTSSFLTVPIGFWLAERIVAWKGSASKQFLPRYFSHFLWPALSLVCLGVLIIIRLV